MKQGFKNNPQRLKGHSHEQVFPLRRRFHSRHAQQHPLHAREAERGRRDRERGIPRRIVTDDRMSRKKNHLSAIFPVFSAKTLRNAHHAPSNFTKQDHLQQHFQTLKGIHT
jgi:hypothetical protein